MGEHPAGRCCTQIPLDKPHSLPGMDGEILGSHWGFLIKSREKIQVSKEGTFSFTSFSIFHFSIAYFLSNATIHSINPSGENS